MSEEHRLHPAAVGAEALVQLRGLVVPIVVGAVLGGREAPARGLVYAFLGVAASVLVAAVRWASTRWWVGDGAVHLRTGVLSRNETSVPFERVQAIDTVRGPVQQLFGVVELHVQAAGGGRRGEIVLRAVSRGDAERVRAAARATGARAPRPELPQAAAGERWTLPARDLVLAGITSGSLGVLLPVVAAIGQFVNDLGGADEAGALVPHTPAGVLELLGGVLLVAFAVSFLGTIAAFARFSVRREDDRLVLVRGLVERREASIPVRRVHALRVVESPLREPFGLAAVRVETAGYGKEAPAAQTLIPLARRSDLPRLLGRLLPELADGLGDLAPAPARAARRYALLPVLAGLAPALVLVAVFGVAGLPALVLPAAGAALGVGRFRAAGFRLSGDRLVLRTRRLARTTSVTDPARVQLVRTAASPLQRRAGLADFGIGVSSGAAIAVRHLDEATVRDLLARVSTRARGRQGPCR